MDNSLLYEMNFGEYYEWLKLKIQLLQIQLAGFVGVNQSIQNMSFIPIEDEILIEKPPYE